MTRSRLAERIARRIRAEGPLSVAAYMAMALHDPELGYYARRRPIGAAGDFVTAPEISQVFGELLGVWCALIWERLDCPDPVVLAELGPGRGTLAADLLRAAAVLPQFRRALRLHLIETSAPLRAEQKSRLAAADPAPVWLDRVEDLPGGPLILVANEFLDALPIRQLVRAEEHWAERMVALDQDGRLVFARGPESPVVDLLVPRTLRRAAPPGAIFEIAPAALALAKALGARLKLVPGAALFVDYGDAASWSGLPGPGPSGSGPSLRGVRDHRPVDVLDAPGTADLSADVDFAAFLEEARAAGAETWGPVLQRSFLQTLGISARLGRLAAGASAATRRQLESGVARLLDPAQMGCRFKAAALISPGLGVPAGFDLAEVRQ
ncbi:MAG: class I SAM-dependent methyltransferase [Stellaceae bacterium]